MKWHDNTSGTYYLLIYGVKITILLCSHTRRFYRPYISFIKIKKIHSPEEPLNDF